MLDLDRKISRATNGLPAFLQRYIQFRDASSEDRPTIIAYSSKFNKGPVKSKRILNQPLYDPEHLKMEWSAVGRVGAGLRNVGNTCFLNSCLQCLCYSVPLNVYLLMEHRKSCLASLGGEHCMLCELSSLFKSMTNNGHPQSAAVPSGIVGRLKGIARHMKPGRQEDAHEFLRYFVDALQKSALFGVPEETPQSIKDTNIMQQIFGGKLRSCITCAKCGHRSITTDPFMDMSLEIRSAQDVQDALALFCQREHLTKGNKYRCESCRDLSEASKQMLIEQLPSILTLHLKRFHVPQSMMNGIGKIHKHVDFSPELDMSPYLTNTASGSTRYQLYAVVVHDGHSTHSGHYYSFIRASNNLWYCMNDESVTQASINTVLCQKAYILFYQRTPPARRPPTPPTTEEYVEADEVINVDECSESASIARGNPMWHMTNSPMSRKASMCKAARRNKRINWRISKCE